MRCRSSFALLAFNVASSRTAGEKPRGLRAFFANSAGGDVSWCCSRLWSQLHRGRVSGMATTVDNSAPRFV